MSDEPHSQAFDIVAGQASYAAEQANIAYRSDGDPPIYCAAAELNCQFGVIAGTDFGIARSAAIAFAVEGADAWPRPDRKWNGA